MKKKLLSICIPVYNREDLFQNCLIEACEASLEIAKEVEIVVSDNGSEEDLFSIVEDVRLRYKTIDIIYHKNPQNIGLCKNFLKVVDIASGKYCWIIGSDDFIKYDGINTIIDIINQNSDVIFISCNYDHIFLNKVVKNNSFGDQYINIHNQLKDEKFLVPHKAPTWSREFNKFDELIDPIFNNVLLGAVMTGIFKKSLWDNVDKSNVDWDGFNSFESIYPHCYVYANAFIGKKGAFYCGKPLITVGEGTREWSTDTGNTFWESSLPLIYFNIWGDMISTYKNNGLDIAQYKKCKKNTSKLAGNYLLPILFRKYLFKRIINDSESIKIMKVLRLYLLTPSFYKGVLMGMLSDCKNIIKYIKDSGAKTSS